MTRLCVCAQDCGAEDYERWSPPQPNKCLMGRNITMERRRRSSDCFNGKEYERAETSSSTCQCTEVQSPAYPCKLCWECRCSPAVLRPRRKINTDDVQAVAQDLLEHLSSLHAG